MENHINASAYHGYGHEWFFESGFYGSPRVQIVISFLQGVPKVRCYALYFIRLYFSTIELVKQIIEAKVVSFNLIHYFHTCCAIFWLEYSICVLPRQRCACASIFSSHIFFVFYSPNCSNSFLVFLWISRKINPLNAKTFSYVRA